jgi:hypothetical protein
LVLYKIIINKKWKKMVTKYLKNKKAQGAIEYLLIVGGVLLVAIIVIAATTSTGRSSEKETSKRVANVLTLEEGQINTPIITDAECIINQTEGMATVKVYMQPSSTPGVTYMFTLHECATCGPTCSTHEGTNINEEGYLQFKTDKITTDGENYYISVYAVKNNQRSPSGSIFSCTAHT